MAKLDFDAEKSIPELSGKVIIITGGTSGLGAASALALSKHNPARIWISGRNSTAAQAVIKKVRSSGSKADVRFLPCDLAKLSSVRAAAEKVLATESRLDIFMANAGIAARPPGTTKDGYEIQFGTNHLGHALLIKKLLPLLSKTAKSEGDARIVSLTSFAYRGASGIGFETLKETQRNSWFAPLSRWLRYGESKLANVLYTKELARRYPEITSVSVIPGFVSTEMVAGMCTLDWLSTRAMSVLFGGMMEPDQGSLNQLWAATTEKGNIRDGALYNPIGRLVTGMSRAADDKKLAQKLWEWTDTELKPWL